MTPCSNSYKTRLSNGSRQQNTCIYLFIILLIAREFELRVFIFNLPEFKELYISANLFNVFRLLNNEKKARIFCALQ